MSKNYLVWGALNAALAIALGAFGAHGLKSVLDAHMLSVFHTGVQYHGYHALGLMLLGLYARANTHNAYLSAAAYLMLVGLVLFCGSLYALSLSGQTAWGMVAPLGGSAFILAWLAFAWGALKADKTKNAA